MFSKSPTGLFFFSCEMTILSFLLLKCSRSGKIQRTPPSQTRKTCSSSTWPRWMLYLQGWFSKVLPTAKSRENKCSISFWEVLVFGVHTALCDLNSPLRQAWLFLSHRKTSAASWYFYKIVLIYIDLYKKKVLLVTRRVLRLVWTKTTQASPTLSDFSSSSLAGPSMK